LIRFKFRKNLYFNWGVRMEDTISKLSKDVVCKEEEGEDGLYLVCRDKDGNVVLRKKIMVLGGEEKSGEGW